MESAYEFDAPKYWMDFETVRLGVEEDDNADLWFSGESVLPLFHRSTSDISVLKKGWVMYPRGLSSLPLLFRTCGV